MPHRKALLVTRCNVCDQDASERCARCGRPLCSDHAPADGRRCEPCETEGARQLELAVAANHDEAVAVQRERQAGRIFGPAVGVLTVLLMAVAVIARGGAWWQILIAVIPGAMLGLISMMFPKALVKLLHRDGRPILDRWARFRTRRKFLAERPGRRLLTGETTSGEET